MKKTRALLGHLASEFLISRRKWGWPSCSLEGTPQVPPSFDPKMNRSLTFHSDFCGCHPAQRKMHGQTVTIFRHVRPFQTIHSSNHVNLQSCTVGLWISRASQLHRKEWLNSRVHPAWQPRDDLNLRYHLEQRDMQDPTSGYHIYSTACIYIYTYTVCIYIIYIYICIPGPSNGPSTLKDGVLTSFNQSSQQILQLFRGYLEGRDVANIFETSSGAQTLFCVMVVTVDLSSFRTWGRDFIGGFRIGAWSHQTWMQTGDWSLTLPMRDPWCWYICSHLGYIDGKIQDPCYHIQQHHGSVMGQTLTHFVTSTCYTCYTCSIAFFECFC